MSEENIINVEEEEVKEEDSDNESTELEPRMFLAPTLTKKKILRDFINIPEFMKHIIDLTINNTDYFGSKVFLSRGLSVSEKEMVNSFDFGHQHKRLYLWVSKDIKLSRYNHVSFDKSSFDFLRELDEIKTGGQFKLHHLKDNYYIFILMLFVDFY
ncbi:3543_t:CDS:2 [Gigaspora margarita]|uniref:3543_t:CDS:1 n=1 Tax=Gigaspora margarita TaxID=4874 RepID=A0ABM8W577_GIGMA|nr:3543_t:CDS:2 [Gigaspora margarita]